MLTLFIWETTKRVLLQSVKTHMKCSIMLHIIRVYTVCKDHKRSSDKIVQHFFNYNLTPLDMYTGLSQDYSIVWTDDNVSIIHIHSIICLWSQKLDNPLIHHLILLENSNSIFYNGIGRKIVARHFPYNNYVIKEPQGAHPFDVTIFNIRGALIYFWP